MGIYGCLCECVCIRVSVCVYEWLDGNEMVEAENSWA